MRRLAMTLGALALGACATTTAAPITYGPEQDGLALHVDAPGGAARGDLIHIDLRMRVDDEQFPEPLTLDHRWPDYFSTLHVTPAGGGETIVINPIDPTAGMLDAPLPEGEPLTRIVRSGESIGRAQFSLSVAWDRLTPGEWIGVVEFAHEGRVHHYDVEGSWHGTLRSQPFAIRITPAPEQWLELRVPAALLGDGDEARMVRYRVRNGFAVGLRYHGNLDDDTTGGSVGGGPDDAAGFEDVLADIADADGPVRFTLFETSYWPEHFWHPGSSRGHYRVLWEYP